MPNRIENPAKVYAGYVIPFSGAHPSVEPELIHPEVCAQINSIFRAGNVSIGEAPQGFDVFTAQGMTRLVLFRAESGAKGRTLFLQMARALKLFRGGSAAEISVLLGNAPDVYTEPALLQKMLELPALVFYSFDAYLTRKAQPAPTVDFALSPAQGQMAEAVKATAKAVADGTLLARELVNRPADYMTPEKLACCATQAGAEAGFSTQVLGREEIERIGMKSFLSVSAGALNPPQFIIMRYQGAEETAPLVALVGKGITFDSGGYSLKNKAGMTTMHTDMGGAAAVIGAIYSAARQKLKINLVGLVPACENLIGPHATLPGSVIGSLLGRTIEVTSTDGEGRLILCDALTYAAQTVKADVLIDIATLTGGASMAVGEKSGVVITEDEELYGLCREASDRSCEKVWRLDMDEELRPAIKSFYADTKNSPGGAKLGGTIIAALFLKPFTLGKRWMHIDMAPVAWVTNEELPYVPKGATGYGVALLNGILRQMETR